VLSSDGARSNSCPSYWPYIEFDSSFGTGAALYEWSYGKISELSRSGATVREDVRDEVNMCISVASAASHDISGCHGYSALILLVKACSDPSCE
jgi:hypothetical protein